MECCLMDGKQVEGMVSQQRGQCMHRSGGETARHSAGVAGGPSVGPEPQTARGLQKFANPRTFGPLNWADTLSNFPEFLSEQLCVCFAYVYVGVC